MSKYLWGSWYLQCLIYSGQDDMHLELMAGTLDVSHLQYYMGPCTHTFKHRGGFI